MLTRLARHAIAATIGTTIGAALLTAAAPVPALALADDAGNNVNVNQVGSFTPDGTITLYGSYRCSGGSDGPVFLSSQLTQGNISHSIGGTPAVCDGALHRWRNSGYSETAAYTHGQAHVTSTLMTLTHDWGIPLPRFLAVQEQDVTLVPTGAESVVAGEPQRLSLSY